MSNIYTLNNTAQDIDSAITRVASADTEPVANSQNMVTSAGVKTYVDTQMSKGLATGYTDAGTSGTATSSGFIIASAKRNSTGNVSNSIRLTITVGSTPFMVKDQTVYSGAQVSLTVPIAKGETYSVTVGSISTLESSKFKAFVS